MACAKIEYTGLVVLCVTEGNVKYLETKSGDF